MIVSALINVYSIYITQKHNKKMVLPIVNIHPFDYVNCIKINLLNEGVGSLIITNIEVINPNNKIEPNLFEHCPILPQNLKYSNYLLRNKDIILYQGKSIEMLDIHFNLTEDFHKMYRDELRIILSDLIIKIEYTDVYKTKFKPYIKNLNLYKRDNN